MGKKKVRKNLKDTFVNPYGANGYSTMGGMLSWLEQCGIKPSDKNLKVVMDANGGKIFYPYQQADRQRIIKTLAKEKA